MQSNIPKIITPGWPRISSFPPSKSPSLGVSSISILFLHRVPQLPRCPPGHDFLQQALPRVWDTSCELRLQLVHFYMGSQQGIIQWFSAGGGLPAGNPEYQTEMVFGCHIYGQGTLLSCSRYRLRMLSYILQRTGLTPITHSYWAQNVKCAKVETPCSTVIVYVFPVLREAVSFIFITPVHFFQALKKYLLNDWMTFGSAGHSSCLLLLAFDCDQLPVLSFLSCPAQILNSLTLCRLPPKYACYTLQVTDGRELELHAARQNTGHLGCTGQKTGAGSGHQADGAERLHRARMLKSFNSSMGHLLTYSKGSITSEPTDVLSPLWSSSEWWAHSQATDCWPFTSMCFCYSVHMSYDKAYFTWL